ncbi:hypothetical protein Barb6_00308 [Bacteroidales bacterium Barb6]|nr:hypothetical protein Barb6_00308 [Bacteroidales bacterium Barb6]
MLTGDAPPYGGVRFCRVAVYGQPVLKELLLVSENILRYFTKIDIEVAPLRRRIINERVKHPELDILNVCRFKVALLDFPHHTPPAFLRLGKRTIGIDVVGIEVIGPALIRIIRHIQYPQRGSIAYDLLLVREKLLHFDGTHIVVRLVVFGDMAGNGVGVFARKDTVYAVPSRQGAVLAVVNVVGKSGFGEAGRGKIVVRRGGDLPCVGVLQAGVDLRAFKIIKIGIPACVLALVMPCNQIGKLRLKGYLARTGQRQQRQLVEQVGQLLTLRLVGCVQSPQQIINRLIPYGSLHRHRHLQHVHHGAAQREILIELIIHIHAKHRLALHTEHGLVFQRNTDRRIACHNALVEDCNRPHDIIHRIIRILGKLCTAGCHPHRPASHIRCPQLNLRA